MTRLNLIWIGMLFSFLSTTSCTSSNDLKQISGSLIFSEIGSHSFSINAKNIEATITMAGSNPGEAKVFEHVVLSNNANYTAKIEDNQNSKLLNNLVVMYEAKSGMNSFDDLNKSMDSGFVKIDWKGFD